MKAIMNVTQFAENTGLSKSMAKKMLDLLYAKDLTASNLNELTRNLKNWIMENKTHEILKGLSDENINSIIDEMIMDRMRNRVEMESQNYSEGRTWLFSDLITKEKQFKAGDKLEVQIMRTGEWDHPIY